MFPFLVSIPDCELSLGTLYKRTEHRLRSIDHIR
jgi:hypothetical protein